jgi:aminopeptidase N
MNAATPIVSSHHAAKPNEKHRSMLARIAAFEFRYQLKNPVFWVTAGLFFLFSYGFVASDSIQIGGGGNIHENGPFSILQTNIIFSVFFMFVTTAFVANVIVRDDDTGYGPIVRSTRVTKFDYLIGRFIGAFGIAALAFTSIPIGIFIGSLMPWLDPETLGPNRMGDYLFGYFVFALPNILITSAILFALATVTRSMMTTYLGVVVLLVAWIVTNTTVRDRPELEGTMALAEPFGARAFGNASRYWTAAERNTVLPDLAGPLLTNRLLWIGISMLFLALAYSLYRFADKGVSKRKQKKQQKLAAAVASEPQVVQSLGQLPTARPEQARGAQLWARTKFEMVQVFKSPAFIILMVIGLFNAIPSLWTGGELFGTPTLPVTASLIPVLEGSFTFVPLLVAIYYAGELVWRERDRKMHEIVDATPLPNWAYVVPKTVAVSLVLLSILLVSVLAAIGVQLAKGHTNLEFGKYLAWYVLPNGIDFILLAVLAVFVQALSPNKYVGWGIMVLYVVLQIIASNVGLEHNLYVYGGVPRVQYSDMNGAGTFWVGAWAFRAYWTAFALILLVAAHLLWRRGTETRLKPRLARAPARLRGTPGVLAGASLLAVLGLGGWIFYNTNVLNEYRTSDEGEKFIADYERKFLPYEKLPQPTVSDVKLDVALYPEELRAVTKGRYLLTNLTQQPIQDVHVRNTNRDLEMVRLDFPGARLASEDKKFGYRIYRLAQPMQPGERRELSFETLRWPRGFRNQGGDTRLVGNGTFLNNFELAPQIGMDRSQLLTDRSVRRRNDLPAELRPAKLEDVSATGKSYFGGGWATADITVSTAADQVPIAPGRKVSDTTQAGRRVARFVSDAPILTFFSVQSARYQEKKRIHNGVELAVYYDWQHPYNVDRMLNAMQASLDYFGPAFGPYQFDQARIIEFPGYASFAQAFANTMPYSEAIGFIADTSDKEEIDYVTYITAHEMAHQWWAHQVIGADMQGGTMLSETLAQYSALMVMKRLYGEDVMRRFLKFELDRYLRSRGGEAVEELPLGRVENQQYIHYRKGSVAMYLLQERLGEAAVNRALSRLVAEYKFKGAPYPRSLDLIRLLREEATTPEQQALITDLFERITLYDLKVQAPTAVRRPDGKWDVTVPVEAKKDVIRMERQPVRTGKQVLKFVTDRKPTHAGVDPYNFYIDRNSADNVAAVS